MSSQGSEKLVDILGTKWFFKESDENVRQIDVDESVIVLL